MLRLARSFVFASFLTLAAGRAHAQGAAVPRGLILGAGVGVGTVQEPESHLHRLGPTLTGRLGVGLGRSAAGMLEVSVHGFGDERREDFYQHIVVPPPLSPDIGPEVPPDDPIVTDPPRVLRTVTALASVQVPVSRDVYVRPGVGISRHSFATFSFTETGTEGRVSHETGPAAELVLGTLFGSRGTLPIALEGFALLSGGEDSTGARWAAGVRVVPMLRF